MNQSLADIYAGHRQGLFTLALSVTRDADQAEDAVHDAFARLVRTKPQIDGDMTAYVFAAVRNAAMDQVRQRGRAPVTVETVFDHAAAAPEIGPELTALDSERDRLIRNALEALPDDQREIVVMKIYGGLTFGQIGEALDLPLQTVASRYRRTLGQMRRQMESLV